MDVAVKSCFCDTEKLTQTEREEAKLIEESCIKVEGQWMVPYPWKKDLSLLLNNRGLAINTKASEKEFWTSRSLLLQANGRDGKHGDCPLHSPSRRFLRPEKRSTTVRIVFNSSWSYQGHTLNDYWKKVLICWMVYLELSWDSESGKLQWWVIFPKCITGFSSLWKTSMSTLPVERSGNR